MTPRWRLLDTGARSAADNIALDRVLLRSRAKGGPSTIRFLRFSEECCLVGYHQAVELEVEEEFCRREGIAICRRITGGGAIYLDPTQLGWEVIAGRDEAGIPRSVQELYELFGNGMVRALNDWGVPARFRRVNDLEVNGKKIGGTGGTAEGGAFLFQGTLLVETDVERMMRCLRVPAAKLKEKGLLNVRDRLTSLRWELGRSPSLAELQEKAARRLAEAAGVELEPGELSRDEQAEFSRIRESFSSDEWIRRIQLPSDHLAFTESKHKAKGGMVRVHVSLDPVMGRIRQVVLTGDFFAYPSRVIPDLEAALKDAPVAPEELRSLVGAFWAADRPEIPGVEPEDFVKPLLAAIRGSRRKPRNPATVKPPARPVSAEAVQRQFRSWGG